MEVFFTTLLRNCDEDDVFLGVASTVERKFDEAMGRQHTVNSSFSLAKKQMNLKIDSDIEIVVRITEFVDVKKESIAKMENVIELYEITKLEMQNIYKNEPALLDVPEPMMYVHKCAVEFAVGHCGNEKYDDVVRNWIDLITKNESTIIFQ